MHRRTASLLLKSSIMQKQGQAKVRDAVRKRMGKAAPKEEAPRPATALAQLDAEAHADQPALTTRAMLAKLFFAGGQKSSPGCSASSASSDGSYRTGERAPPTTPAAPPTAAPPAVL